MATNFWIHQPLEQLRQTRVWRSIFRRGPARTNRTRSLAVFGNPGLHMMPVKVREKSLSVRAAYYLASISFFLFGVNIAGEPLWAHRPFAPRSLSACRNST